MTTEIDTLLSDAEAIHKMVDAALDRRLRTKLSHSYIKKTSRIKSRDSIEEKIARKNAQCTRALTDLIGFRLICHFQPDIANAVRMVLGMIKEKYGLYRLVEPAIFYTTNAPNQSALRADVDTLFNEFKESGMTYVQHTKDSRYTSIHLICEAANAEGFPPIEIQVRNVFEEAWSSIEHAANYKRPASATVRRHLTVLQSMVQCCVEYAEAIRVDMDDIGVDRSGSIKPLITYDEDIAAFPYETRELFKWIMNMREAEKHQEILKRIAKSLDDSSIQGDALYFLRMEEALSYLKLNNLNSAQSLYENIAVNFPSRAMVPHRLSDVFKLKNEYVQALEYAKKAEHLLNSVPQGSSKTERNWITTYLPLKKAYYLWRMGDVKAAHHELAEAYAKLPANVDAGVRRKFFSSLIYYALEVSVAADRVDKALLSKYLEQMRASQMESIETALPEEVDTYAWVCHHLGLHAEATRAILEVVSCLQTKDPALGPMFVHKGKHWGITFSDASTIYEHMREILMGQPKIR